MSEATKHTPIPWRFNEYLDVMATINGGTSVGVAATVVARFADYPYSVALDKETVAANAAFVVQAANNFESLLSAAKAALELTRCCICIDSEKDARLMEARDGLNIAIARAEA